MVSSVTAEARLSLRSVENVAVANKTTSAAALALVCFVINRRDIAEVAAAFRAWRETVGPGGAIAVSVPQYVQVTRLPRDARVEWHPLLLAR